MSTSASTKLKVGFITILGLFILFAGILWVKNYNPAVRKLRMSVSFSNGGGITGGDVVLMSGVKVGEVTDVSLGDDNKAVVRFWMNHVDLSPDTEFRIKDIGLMGDKAVVIEPGIEPGEIDPDIIHMGREESGLTSLITEAGGIMQRLDSISEKIDNNLDIAKLAGDLEATLAGFREAIDAYRELAENTRDPLNSSLRNLESSSEDLKKFIDSNDDRISETIESLEQTSSRLSAFIDDMGALPAVIDTVAAYMENGDGTLARLVKSDELYEELRQTNAHIDSFIIDFKKNPGKYTEDMNFKVRLF